MRKGDGIRGLARTTHTIKDTEINLLRKQTYSCKQCASCREWNWNDEHLTGFLPGVTKTGFVICPIYRHTEGFQTDFAEGKVRLVQGLVDGAITASDYLGDKLFQCTQCAACTEYCPQARVDKLDPSEVIRVGRGLAVKSGGNQPKEITIMTHRPVKPRSLPTSWIPHLHGSTSEASLAYFPGCVFGESFKHPSIANCMISILQVLGQPFQVLTEGWCCGYPAFTSGNTTWATTNAQMVAERLRALKVKRLIVSCAWGFRMFSREYPRLLGKPLGVKVFHASEFLHHELRSGRLKLLKPWKVIATYHDPCQLGRRCGVYDPPRELIKAIPELRLVEMVENREEALCSGGGGGVAAAYPDLSNAIAVTRVKQATDVNAQVILTACPYCRNNLQQGINSLESKLVVIDLIEAIANSINIEAQDN